MQYVGQTCRFLKKTRFSEHYCRLKKPSKIDNFHYRHFSFKLITLLAVFLFNLFKNLHMMIIPLKDIKNILRLELELKWLKLLQTPNPLGFNDNIYHEGNISRLPDFYSFFSLLDIRKRNNQSHGKRKMEINTQK